MRDRVVRAPGDAARPMFEAVQAVVRRDIALDLHDTVLQPLVSLVTSLECLRHEQVNGDTSPERLDVCVRVAREAVRSLRSVVSGMRPDPCAALDLIPALREHLIPQVRATGLTVDMELRRWPADVPREQASELYVAIGEALANVVRHAHASRASLCLDADARWLRVTVSDDGVGLRPGDVGGDAERESGGGLGLVSMRERLRALGGDVTIRSRPGKGVCVQMRVPAAPPEAQACCPTLRPGAGRSLAAP